MNYKNIKIEKRGNYAIIQIANNKNNSLDEKTLNEIANATKHLNQLGYVYRSKRDIETGNQVGVERRPLPMFPLILTFGIKFEF